MSKNAIIGIVVAAVLVAGGIIWYTQNQGGTSSQPYGTPNQNASSPAPYSGTSGTRTNANGRVIFSVTDAAASMQNISSVKMTVSKVDAHSETQGWVSVSNGTKEFDLVQLKAAGKTSLESVAELPAGTYNQIRMEVDKVIVVQSGTAKQAKLPSGELKINADVKVEGNATSSVKFDFLADKSLHVTGKGEFIFAPVVKVESRSRADVRVAADGSVSIQGGTVDASVSEGMDNNGEMKVNFILNTNAGVEIDGGIIKLQGSGAGKGGVNVGY